MDPSRRVLAVLVFVSWFPGFATAAGPAAELYQAAGRPGGLVVELPFVDAQFTVDLGSPDSLTLQTLHPDRQAVAEARNQLQAAEVYGKITAEAFDGRTLPYADNLVNLVVLHQVEAERLGIDVPREEILRVLTPGGVLCRWPGPSSETAPEIIRKPWPAEIAPWTHFLGSAAGNAVAADRRVAPAAALQWLAEPLYCRSHEIDSSLPAMVSSNGRLFYILDEGPIGVTDPRFPARWALLARDAFNGVLLWKQLLEPWGWQEWNPERREADWRLLRGQRGRFPAEVPRRLVAVDDRVYVTLGFHDAPISILDVATGQVIVECPGTEGTQELIVDQNTIFARIQLSQATAAQRRGEKPTTRLAAIDARTGQTHWSQDVGNMNRLTLTAADGAVVFQRGQALFCYKQTSGELRWQAACPPSNIVVIHDGVVLATGKAGTNAFGLQDGHLLWNGPATGRDLLVIDNLVWRIEETLGILERREEVWPTLSRRAGARLSGYDFRTGQLQRTLDVPNAMSPGHHLRCYRSKATDRFIIYPKRGAEFLDLEGDSHMRHDWLRGSCQYGILPCNGLLYTPPDQCFCYPGAKMNGLVATTGADSNGSSPVVLPTEARAEERLTRGPAYGRQILVAADPTDWPGYRADAKRSGANRSAAVADDLNLQWEIKLGGKLTQPVIAAGRVYVAAVDRHVIHALRIDNGQPLWDFTAGGRINSSPTYHEGLLLFGANDGCVYCLDAATGELVWRFQAAPQPRKIVAFGQVESPWPVHGTVLILNSLVYVAAGRSTLVDGGAWFYALDPRTGNVVHDTRVRQGSPDLAQDIGEHFAMDGSNIDILTTDGTHIFCMQEMFDTQLNRIETPWHTRHGDRYLGEDHLIATGGILDDSGFNRLFWTYGNRWPGFYMMLMAPRSGNLLVFDQDHTWATKWFVERNIHSPLFFPQTTGYLLFCDRNTTQPFLVGDPDAPEPIRWLPDTLMEPYQYDGRRISNRYDDYAVEVDKGAGFTRGAPAEWQEYVPVRIEALALARDLLLAAGTPDVFDPADPLGALEGRRGGVLLAIDPQTGRQRSETRLREAPRFDGMAVAGNRLLLVSREGTLSVWE